MTAQRELVGRHILSWLQDQPYFRARWHRAVQVLDFGPAGDGAAALDGVLREVAEVRMQYPFGHAPDRAGEALLLQARLSILYAELVNLRILTGRGLPYC